VPGYRAVQWGPGRRGPVFAQPTGQTPPIPKQGAAAFQSLTCRWWGGRGGGGRGRGGINGGDGWLGGVDGGQGHDVAHRSKLGAESGGAGVGCGGDVLSQVGGSVASTGCRLVDDAEHQGDWAGLQAAG
jgi:hypothetical protein